MSGESSWHLSMKGAVSGLPGWELEYCWPAKGPGCVFRFDAFHPGKSLALEFVHSLSPTYLSKNEHLLKRARQKFWTPRVLWIFDGGRFYNTRGIRPTRDRRGRRKFLNPAALEQCRALNGIVLWNKELWREWKNNVWYPGQEREIAGLFSDVRDGVSSDWEHELEEDDMDFQRTHIWSSRLRAYVYVGEPNEF